MVRSHSTGGKPRGCLVNTPFVEPYLLVQVEILFDFIILHSEKPRGSTFGSSILSKLVKISLSLFI